LIPAWVICSWDDQPADKPPADKPPADKPPTGRQATDSAETLGIDRSIEIKSVYFQWVIN
jgi:hypothetical protein